MSTKVIRLKTLKTCWICYGLAQWFSTIFFCVPLNWNRIPSVNPQETFLTRVKREMNLRTRLAIAGLAHCFVQRWKKFYIMLKMLKTALYRNSLQQGWATVFSRGPKSSTKKPGGPTSLSKPSWRAKIQQNITLF
jgi:hypothetical protein